MNSKNESPGLNFASRMTLIYFPGCPTYNKMKSVLDSLNITCNLVNQDNISADSEYAHYSSPTMLLDGNIIYGSKIDHHSRGCSLGPKTEKEMIDLISSAILNQ